MRPDDADLSVAVAFVGAADAIREALAIAMLPVERALFDQTMRGLRERMSDGAFETAFARGKTMNEQEAIALSETALR